MPASSLLALERVLRGKTAAIDPAGAKQVLLLEYQLPLGCVVHLTPLYEALKLSRPDIAITVATRGLGLQVLRHSPHIDHLIETPDPLADLTNAAKSLRKDLRSRNIQPDCVLTGASDQRTRIALLGALASSGWRGGFTINPALYQRPLVNDKNLSLIANNLKLAQLLQAAPQPVEPHLFFSKADSEKVEILLQQANPGQRPLVVMVTQNSGGQKTGWHTERFAEVIRHVAKNLDCAIVYAGTAADAAAIETIRNAAAGIGPEIDAADIGTSLAGKTSVTELAALLAAADAIVSLDTGTMHVGRAVKTPMVVLGPSWQRPIEWLPLGIANIRILRGPDRDTIPENYQLDEITAQSVIDALEDLLRTYPPSPQARLSRAQHSLSTIDHLNAHLSA
jgi:ADP-heptose:LPS heptosyltransferase